MIDIAHDELFFIIKFLSKYIVNDSFFQEII